MRISVVCLASRSGGGLTILKDLLNFARRNTDNHKWQFLLSDQDVGTGTSNIEIVHISQPYKGWRSRFWAEMTSGRKKIKGFEPDVVLSLQNIDTPARGGYPLALYMHQSLPFQKDYKLSFLNPAERKIAWRQYLLKYPIKFSIGRARVTFVQTRWLADSILEICPQSEVYSIGFNIAPKSKMADIERQRSDMFFYPAPASPYKNHQLIHQALQILKKEGFDLSNKMTLTLKEADLGKVVTGGLSPDELEWYRCVGWITAEEVHKEYSRSILVFPSLVESLGLPLYEAKETGATIVAPDLPYAREALYGYPNAIWFASANPSSLADALKKSLSLSPRKTYEYGREPNSLESWETMLSILNK